MKSIFLLPLLLAASVSAFAQDFSNKGKDFWLGYGYHVRYVTGGFGGNNGQEMVLYFATENIPGRFTDIRIEIPATGYVQNITNVAPGTIVTSNPIPKSGSQDARLTTEGLFQSGIHVTSSRPVVAYTHIYNGNVSGATLLFPTNTLGKEYYAMNYTQLSNEGSSNAFFFVVATDTGTTTVEITPSAQTLTHAAGVPFVVSLNQGEIYNVMGVLTGGSQGNFTGTDLTGSKIRSISNGGVGCKRIAVFSGTGKIKIACNSNAASSDNLIAQAFPKTAWGQKFLTVPTANMPFNFFRIGVSDPSTNVRVNGILQTGLVGDFYYDLPLTSDPQLIEADQPIMVAQYITTAGACNNNLIGGDGDPEMIYLSPVEQTIDEVVLNSTPNAAIGEHWVNVVIRTNAIGSFNITGAQGGYIFLPHPQDPSYSYAQINVTSGSHTLSADSGFNAIAYGYGNAESYGYNAGTNLKDLYNFIEPLNPLNISGTNSACACTPFYYTITYPYQPLSLFWDFKGFQPNVSISNPVADSTYQINGKQVWRYKLPTPYTYCPAGNYPLSITAGIAGADGCGNTQVKDDTLFVRNTPLPDFTWVHNGCVSDSLRFSDASVYDEGVYSYQWSWDFGDGTTSTAPSPVHKYANPGTYTVSFSLITNIGCISETRAKQVTVTEVPVAKFGISDLSCIDGPVLFSDSSSVPVPGTIGAWYWDFGDGVLDTTFTGDNLVHIYNTAGPKTATLFIETPSGCRSNLFDKTFTIHPKPVVDFVLPAKVCLPYDLANFTDASTIADGTEAGFSWKWKFGEPSSGVRDSSVLKNPAHLYSGVGPFTISLQVTSAAGCADSSSKVLSNVFAKASAGFTVNPENCFNTVTNFTSTANGQGNTITNWLWDYGDLSPVADGQNVSHTYATASTFQVKHWVLTDKSCFSDTVTLPVTINPLPVANFNFGAPACEKNNVSIIDISTAGAGNISTWTWNFGTGRPDSIINNNLPFTYRYDTTGTYTVSLRLLTDKGCSTATALSKTIAVTPLPKPGFVSPEVCLTDASAQFVDTSSIAAGSITGWAWNFGDPGSGANNTSTVQNALHSYNAIGLYTARLTVTSNAGCVDSLFQSFTVNGDIPKADFNPLLTVPFCANDTVTITDNSTVNFGTVTKVEIYWDVVNEPAVKQTDDLPAPGKVYTHRYPDFQNPLSKDVFIRYKSYSGTTCVDSVTKRITLHASPKVQFVTVPPVCFDAVNYQLTEASETGGVPGIGVFTGAGIGSTGLFTPSVTGVGTFPVLYTYTSGFGCVDTISNSITVLAPAAANFGVSQPACEKNSISFTDSSLIPAASGSIVNRAWNFGDGTPVVNSASTAPVLHTFAAFGNYPVTLTLTSSNGCIVNKQLPVAVSPLPVPDFSFPATACLPNASITFTDASGIADGTENTFTYSWRFGDPSSGNNNTSVSKNPTHVFSTTGPYSITLTTQSGAGCRDSVTRLLNTIHPQPIARLTSDSASICETQAVRFSDNSDGADGTVNNWSWDFGNGGSSLLQFPPAQTYANAGIYNIVLQVENTFGCKDTTVVPFTVYANPVISAGPDRVLLEGGEITIDANALGSGLQFAWAPALYLNNPRILKPLVKGIPDDILYTLTVVASGGCWRQDEVLVKLLRAPIIPNTFTPNGDGKNDTWIIQHLESYPEAKIRVFSRDGQALYESNGYNISGWDGRYNGKVLPFGTYYYVIEPGSGRKPITGYVTIIY